MFRSSTGTCHPNKSQVHLRALKPTVLDSFMFLLDTESCSKMSQNMTKIVKIIILEQGNFSKLENYFGKVFLFCKTCFVKLIIQQNFLKLENSFAKFREIFTVILFSSRYLFPAKSICPTCEQAIQIFMQIRAAAPPNRKLRHIFV